MISIQALHKTEILFLRIPLQRHGRIEIQNARLFGPDDGALIHGRQPAIAEVIHAEHRQSARVRERHVSRQVLILGPQSIREPTAQRRAATRDGAIEQGVDGLAVIVHSRVHGADHRHLIGNAAHVRNQVAEVHAALAVFAELPLRPHDLAAGTCGVIVFDFAREVFAVQLHELWLRLKEVDVARSTLHEHGDHRLRLTKSMRRFGLQIIVTRKPSESWIGQQSFFLQKSRQSDRSHAIGTGQKMTSR